MLLYLVPSIDTPNKSRIEKNMLSIDKSKLPVKNLARVPEMRKSEVVEEVMDKNVQENAAEQQAAETNNNNNSQTNKIFNQKVALDFLNLVEHETTPGSEFGSRFPFNSFNFNASISADFTEQLDRKSEINQIMYFGKKQQSSAK